jgi:hypothetical protein
MSSAEGHTTFAFSTQKTTINPPFYDLTENMGRELEKYSYSFLFDA